ncbi:DUF6816 family protein [Prochlorococcus marinus]|uniref:DUF6816 family protein n=1 Tax=Prochlorococcus marinus TaxID=1219 RepID=UPI0022B318CA|nr:POLO box duplicated region [Prochlorococcus marinus]
MKISFLYKLVLKVIILSLLCTFNFFITAPVDALIEDSHNISLVTRQSEWPEWKLPGPFKRSALKKDIVYPPWFNGFWIVKSIDVNQTETQPIEYQAKFQINNSQELVGERSFNAMSLGKAILGDKILYVKDDPISPNRQLAKFEDQEFLETKVIGRNQSLDNASVFFVDELVLQVFHSLDVSRVKQVETLSKYQLCNSSFAISEDFSDYKICGEQWQAIYPAPGERLASQPLKTRHYKLILDRG